MAADNLTNWGCGQVGKNLDIRGEELLQMEGMRKLGEILEKDEEKEENPRSGCDSEVKVGQRGWEMEFPQTTHLGPRTQGTSGCGRL